MPTKRTSKTRTKSTRTSTKRKPVRRRNPCLPCLAMNPDGDRNIFQQRTSMLNIAREGARQLYINLSSVDLSDLSGIPGSDIKTLTEHITKANALLRHIKQIGHAYK